jgi:uncharacterized protein YndB with AHSA1/START domain
MFLAILLILLALVAGLVIYAATRPDEFKVERAAVIAAPPATVYALLEDFRRWTEWSPWEKMDPALSRDHGGAAKGVGAVYGWSGNKKVGQGRMEITEADPPSRLVIRLEFIAPWQAVNKTVFTLAPVPSGTGVTWTMTGKSPFVFKLLGLFCPMDKMVGRDFEAGLADMKAAAEGGRAAG